MLHGSSMNILLSCTLTVYVAAAVQTHGAAIYPAVKLCWASKNKCGNGGRARGPQAGRMEVLMRTEERETHMHTHAHTETEC